MEISSEKQYIKLLQGALDSNPDIQALALLNTPEGPDEVPGAGLSFMLITQAQKQGFYRSQISWLPRHEDIAFFTHDDTHVIRVFYQDGLLLDIAVYDKSELFLGQFDNYQLLFDHAGLNRDLDQVVQMTQLRAQTHQAPLEILWERLLYTLYKGLLRSDQKEALSAHHLLTQVGVDIVLQLLIALHPEWKAQHPDRSDIRLGWSRLSPHWDQVLSRLITLPAGQFVKELWNELTENICPQLPPECKKGSDWFNKLLSERK